MKLVLAFALLALGMILPSAFASSASVTVNGVNHDVTYEATGLAVDGIDADTATATISVSVTTETTPGTLTITLDRSFFDSKTDGTDDEFLVLLDGGQDVTPVEEKTDTARTLTITVPSGTNSVDIVSLGTTNFGSGSETPVETPTETPTEESVEEPATSIPEPTIECGPGTTLDSTTNTCVAIPVPIETPVETPEEPPLVVSPAPEQTQQCGPGTILKDGQCVLDETCGAGTVLQDGQCVLDDSAPAPTSGGGSQFITALVAGFVIAFVVMIILWAIGKAGRAKD